MSLYADRSIVIALKDATERVYIRIWDDTGALVEPESLSLAVYRYNELQFEETDFSAVATNIVTEADGIYYFLFGDTSIDAHNDSSATYEYVFIWSYQLEAGANVDKEVQVVKVMTPTTLSLIPKLRLAIDKAAKQVEEHDGRTCYLGYTDWMLIGALEDGLQYINAQPPYPMWSTIDSFPLQLHGKILQMAAEMCMLMSQEIFAIDTDINYSDNGQVFTIDHYPKLAAALTFRKSILDTTISAMKRHYLRNGSVLVELGPNVRFNSLVSAAPSNSLFRNMFLGG